jgi:hypothetical protein
VDSSPARLPQVERLVLALMELATPPPLPVLPTHLPCPFAFPTLLPRGPLVVHMRAGPGAPGTGSHPRVLCDLTLLASRAGIHPKSLAGSYGVARFRTSKPFETYPTVTETKFVSTVAQAPGP